MKRWKKAAVALWMAAVLVVSAGCAKHADSKPAAEPERPETVQQQMEETLPDKTPLVSTETAAPEETMLPEQSAAPEEETLPEENEQEEQEATPAPTETPAPTATPAPTKTPAPTGTPVPTETPKATPTGTPAAAAAPSATPTVKPTTTPAATPTVTPAATPTAKPTATPTPEPTPKKASWEKQVDEKLEELESLHVKMRKQLHGVLVEAWAEYEALPVEERGLPDKIRICLSKGAKLLKMEGETDKAVKEIVADMRKILKENGQPTTVADEAQKAYDKLKSDLNAELMKQAYSGGDGSYKTTEWLFDGFWDEA